MFQKNEFKAEVVRRNLTLENVANAIGIDAATLHRKMNGASDFYRSEIEKIIKPELFNRQRINTVEPLP